MLYTRLLSFCLVLFAAWSAFFTGLAAAAARTNTGRLANGTTTREVHDTPSNKKKHIHRQNPHNPGQIRFTPPKKKHQNPKPWTNSHFARSAATRLTAGFVPANSKQSSYPTLPPSTVTIHNPSPIHKLTSHRIPLQMGMEGTTNEERERTEQPSPSPLTNLLFPEHPKPIRIACEEQALTLKSGSGEGGAQRHRGGGALRCADGGGRGGRQR